MTVSTTTRKQQFVKDGATAAFAFTFRAIPSAPTDIKCKLTSAGVDTDLAYTTDYTVVVNTNGVGGTVTLTNTAGTQTLTVYRETTNKQESDYDDYNQFPADTVQSDLDKRTLVSQESTEEANRSFSFPITYSGTASTLIPTPVASKVLAWNSIASALENINTPTGSTGAIGPTGPAGSIENSNASPADNSASGIKPELTAGESLVFGDFCSVKSDGKMWKADASAIATSNAVAMCCETLSADESGDFLFYGFATDTDWNWVTVGGLVYLSTTAGSLTQTIASGASEVIQVIGVATDANRIWMNPSLVQVEHT